MTKTCAHLASIRRVHPSAKGCEECLKLGVAWVHLRLCRTCGHVGCRDGPARRAGHCIAMVHSRPDAGRARG